MSVDRGEAEIICSFRVFRILTQLGLWMFGRIFRLDGREAIANCGWSRYAALTVQAEAAPHE
jgi:hypothetical protein